MSQTNGKGKERAPPPPNAEVITLEDSDVDSDTEFFTAKPVRRNVKRRTTQRQTSSPLRQPARAPSYELGGPSDSDSDGEAEERRKRRRAKARVAKPTLPEWTRAPTRSSVDRGQASPAGRDSAEPISLLSSDEEETDQKGKGKAPDRPTKRFRQTVELTPPPEVNEAEELARFDELNRQLFQGAELLEDDTTAVEVASSSPAPVTNDATVMITVQMVADPDKRTEGSETAVRNYERKRVFNIFQNDPVSKVLGVLAQRIQRPVEQLVLTHEGHRIFSTDKTPAQLGILISGEMKGYELSIYEKIQREERRARLAMFDGGEYAQPKSPEEDDPSTSAVPEASPSPPRAPSPQVEKVKLHLRGPRGEVRFSASPTNTVAAMLKFYCHRNNIDPSEVHKFRLEFDGEHFPDAATIEDMGVESGDQIDVMYRG